MNPVARTAAALSAALFSATAAWGQQPGLAIRGAMEIQRVQQENNREWNRMQAAQFNSAMERRQFDIQQAARRYQENPCFQTALAFQKACRPMVLSPAWQAAWEEYYADLRRLHEQWHRSYDSSEERNAMARLAKMRADEEQARKVAEQHQRERDARWDRFKTDIIRNFGRQKAGF